MNRRVNGSSRLHSSARTDRNGFSEKPPKENNNGFTRGERDSSKRKGGGPYGVLSSATISILLLVAIVAGAAALALSSKSSDRFFDRALPLGYKYDICFVSSAFASSTQESDKPADVTFYCRGDNGCLFFTNLPGLQVRGWTKIIQSYPYAHPYKRFKTHSGALKFMSWREPVVQQHCSFVFYIDATFVPTQDLAYYQRIRDQVMQSPGRYGLALHPEHQNGIYHEFELILENEKDIRTNVELTLENLHQQPDFRNDVPVYDNAFLCYDPTSIVYQTISNRFWSHYALEQDSWRDQPWWAYTISQYPQTPPFILPTRKETMTRRGKKGLNGHHYNESSETKDFRRTHPPIDSCVRLTLQGKAGALPSNWPDTANAPNVDANANATFSYQERVDDEERVENLLVSRTKVKPLELFWTQLLLSKISSSKQKIRILTVGANNFSYLTILLLSSSSSSLGSIVVDVFEPNKRHVLSLCESIQSNHWTSGTERQKQRTPHVQVNPYGLSNKEGTSSAATNATAGMDNHDTWNNGNISTSTLETTTLDNIAQERRWFAKKEASTTAMNVPPDMVLLQMDSDHFLRAKAVLGAKQFVEEHLAHYVVLEMAIADNANNTMEESLSLLVQAGYRLLRQGWNGDGDSERSVWPQDSNLVSAIVTAARGRSQDRMHLLWSL